MRELSIGLRVRSPPKSVVGDRLMDELSSPPPGGTRGASLDASELVVVLRLTLIKSRRE